MRPLLQARRTPRDVVVVTVSKHRESDCIELHSEGNGLNVKTSVVI